MRRYGDLTEGEKATARNIEWRRIIDNVLEGIRFSDNTRGDNLQATIDAAVSEADRMQTPWFAGEYIRDAVYTDSEGNHEKVGDLFSRWAQEDAEDAFYPNPEEIVIRL